MNVTSFEGTIVLRCGGFGFPIPTITWFQNGSLVEPEENENVTISTTQSTSDLNTSSVLTIVRPEMNNSGDYRCALSSSVAAFEDVMSEEVLVLVQGKQESGSYSLVLDLSLVEKYISTSFADTPEQPQNVMAVGVGSREINLTWVEPHDNNAPITGYLIMYMEPGFVTGERMRVVNTSAVEMATITGLFPGVDYMVMVIAYNEIGDSDPSDPLLVRTLDESEST